MRIAIVTTSYPLHPDSFAGHFVATEAKTLQRAGQDVVVCAPGTLADRSIAGVHVVTLGGARLFQSPGALPQLKAHPHWVFDALSFMLRTRRWLRKNGPFDRVQAHWLIPCGWPIASAAAADLEFVCHGSDVKLLQRFPRLLQSAIFRRIEASGAELRCVSDDLRTQLLQMDPGLASRITVQPCPIDVSTAPPRAAARSKLNLDANAIVILIVARLIPSKAVDVALAAVAPLLATRTDRPIQMVVIGAGPELEALRTHYPFARFLGEQPRSVTLSWIAAADLLVSASTQEGAPTVVREARALHVPVVCAAAGDVRLWAAQDPGIQVFESPRAIADALQTALAALG